MDAGGPGPLWGVRGLGCQLRSFPSSGTRGVSGPVPKSGGTHSRVAERTRLFPEGKYSGKCQAIRPI